MGRVLNGLYINCNMSSPGPAYLFGSSLVQESPIADKYYLQLADHSLLDLLREAVKSILIFNLPLQELPILHLQKEIYLIYDNRFIKEQDIVDAIKHEIRETAKLQKKFLDMSFTYLEKEKATLSDMRDPEEDAWSVSWTRHRAKDTDESLKKSYGVVANLFCNNYLTFVQSFKQIAQLLNHLNREGLIPPIDVDQLEESLLEIVTHQFFLQYNCLDLHKVLPIMAQHQKERFVFCSTFGVDLRKKISKFTCDQSIYDIFMPKKQDRLSSPSQPEHDNKNELKQLMKEMFLKEFRNNDIISPLLFDEKGKLKLFDSDFRNEDEEDQEEAEREIAKLITRKALSSDPKKELKAEEQAKLDAWQEALKLDAKFENNKKEVKTEIKKQSKLQQSKKEVKQTETKRQMKTDPLRSQIKPDPKEKKYNGSPIKTESVSSQNLKQKQTFEIPLIKSESKKQEQAKIKTENASQKSQAKDPKAQLKQKSKSSIQTAVKQEKTKTESENKLTVKQPTKEQKTLLKKKESESPDPTKQASKQKETSAESLQVSTTKIVLSSGTTLEARVTSLTISAEDPDKFNKNINLLKEIHTMRKSMSNVEVLQQLAKDYGSEIKWQYLGGEKPNTEEEDREDNEAEEPGKKKRKKNKKKKNKKGEELKEDLIRAKSESMNEHGKVEFVKSSSLQKAQASKLDSLTEEERAIYNNIENLQIDDKARVECKIDEEVLNGWRKQFFALKKSFHK